MHNSTAPGEFHFTMFHLEPAVVAVAYLLTIRCSIIYFKSSSLKVKVAIFSEMALRLGSKAIGKLLEKSLAINGTIEL